MNETLNRGAAADAAPPSLLARWSKWLGARQADAPPRAPDTAQALSPREAARQRDLLLPCFQARLTDVAANHAIRAWQDLYRAAEPARRGAMLGVLAETGAEAGAPADSAREAQPSDLSRALSHARVRFFKRLNALPDGLPFLLALRADMLAWRARIPGLRALDADLEGLLSNWFDVGLLELRRITWDSPASLLEKLMVYEAVHEIASWADLRNRVDSDRRCYAFFHPRMPSEPLIFVEIAFSSELAGNVQGLLDEAAPMEDLDKARWAIFYSISNTQAGLRGVSFGNFLLKRVIAELNQEFPKVKRFATLSPMPGFCDWLRQHEPDALAALARAVDEPGDAPKERAAAMRLAARYLAAMKNHQPLDPVARFHLGNGARIERLNWKADLSPKGRAQSCGLMVNYVYELDALDANLARLGEGRPATGRAFAKWL